VAPDGLQSNLDGLQSTWLTLEVQVDSGVVRVDFGAVAIERGHGGPVPGCPEAGERPCQRILLSPPATVDRNSVSEIICALQTEIPRKQFLRSVLVTSSPTRLTRPTSSRGCGDDATTKLLPRNLCLSGGTTNLNLIVSKKPNQLTLKLSTLRHPSRRNQPNCRPNQVLKVVSRKSDSK